VSKFLGGTVEYSGCKRFARAGENRSDYHIVVEGRGCLVEFGVDYEEMNVGVGNYSVAIIMLKDGSLIKVPVECIRFIGISND